MKNNLILFFVALFVMSLTLGRAQGATESNAKLETPTATLHWSDALQLLKKNNLDYQSAIATFKSTESLELGAQQGYWPSVYGSLGYNQSQTFNASDNSTNYTASLNLSQSLFAGLRDYYKSSQASANTRIALATLQTSLAKISNTYVLAYQNLIYSQKYVALTENILSRRKENLRLVELRFESGRENRGSVYLSEAYLAQAKYENLQARQSLELSRTTLAHALGTDEEQVFKLTDPIPMNEPPSQVSYEDLATVTPAYKQALASVDSNVAAIGVSRSSFFPSLNFTGSVGNTSQTFSPKADRWNVGATITIPLFDGWKDMSSVQSAAYTKEASSFQKKSVDQQQMEALKQAHQKFIQVTEKLKVDESFQKAALTRSEIARQQYSNGLINFTDWDLIENDLIARQKNFLQSQNDRVIGEANWNLARGAGVLE